MKNLSKTMMKTTHFTEQDITEFNQIYRKTLATFIQDNYLGLKENRSFHLNPEHTYSISSLKDSDGYNSHEFIILQKHLLSYSLEKFSYPYSPFTFQNDREYQYFIQLLYHILTPIQITMYEHADFSSSPDCVNVTHALNGKKNILFNYLQKNISTHFNIKSHFSDMATMLQMWKNIFNESQFNILFVQLLTEHASSIKRGKKYLQLTHFLIDTLIDSIKVREDLSQLFPLDQDIQPFLKTESQWYEVLIDKKNVEKLIILPHQEAYKKMHEEIIEALQKIQSQLGIEKIQLDHLFKKQPIGSILIKINSDSMYSKNKFEELLFISYQAYATLYQDNSISTWNIKNHLTYDWFMRNYLEKTMSVNSASSPNKNKL